MRMMGFLGSVHTLLHLQHCTNTYSHAIMASLSLKLHCMALKKRPFCSTLYIEISQRTIHVQVKLLPRTDWKPFRTCRNLPPWEACSDEGYCKELYMPITPNTHKSVIGKLCFACDTVFAVECMSRHKGQWFCCLCVLRPWCIIIHDMHPVGHKNRLTVLNMCICRNMRPDHVISVAVIMAFV